MCLIVNNPIPKIADKDIVCYKLVKRTKIKGVYKSSFLAFEYIIRQLYTNNLDIRFALKTAFKQRAVFKIVKCNK